MKGYIMKKFCETGRFGILLAVFLIAGYCSISLAAEDSNSTAPESRPFTTIEQKMQQKITLNYRDVPIDDILRAISEQVDLNIVKSPEITKTVTVSISNVPLGEALNQILTAYDCGYVASDNIIRIVPASQLTQQTERTTSKIYRIWYANVKDVEQALTKILTPNRGSIASSAGTSNIIVTDTESKIKAIDEFLQEIDRPTPEILVEARIYDITNTDGLDFGIKWSAQRNTGYGEDYPSLDTDSGNVTGGPITGFSRSDPYINGTFSSTTNKATGATGLLEFGLLNEHVNIDVLMNAQQVKDSARLLANPRILVLDNETASFKAVRQIPYQELQQGGYQSYGTTEFKDVGVELEVTPHLTKDGKVRLHIKPVFSVHVDDVDLTLVGSGDGITMPQPVVDKREADTIALVQSNNTVVIGGLRKQEVTQEISKIPLLGDIPLLGWLFKYKGEQIVNSELVVFITPRVIENQSLTETEKVYLEETEIPHPLPPDTMIDPATRELKRTQNKMSMKDLLR